MPKFENCYLFLTLNVTIPLITSTNIETSK